MRAASPTPLVAAAMGVFLSAAFNAAISRARIAVFRALVTNELSPPSSFACANGHGVRVFRVEVDQRDERASLSGLAYGARLRHGCHFPPFWQQDRIAQPLEGAREDQVALFHLVAAIRQRAG